MAGWVRSMSRQRPLSGPTRPMGIPSSALILASGTGGSSIRSVSSRWQPVGRWARASRNAVWRSANWSSCSGSYPAAAAVASGVFAACGVCPWACGRRAACKARADSRAVAVASQAGSVAGSRIVSSWSASRHQTVRPTSPASASASRCRRQIDQTSGAYRSTSASQACWSRPGRGSLGTGLTGHRASGPLPSGRKGGLTADVRWGRGQGGHHR